MRVMVMIRSDRDTEAGRMPDERLLTDMGAFNEALVKAGVMLAGDGLKPSSQGARVLFSGKHRTVVDGPFAETKELVAGYWVWQVKSLDDAIEWVKRCPSPLFGDSIVEIRPLYELEDFADAMTPEQRDQFERARVQVEALQKSNQR